MVTKRYFHNALIQCYVIVTCPNRTIKFPNHNDWCNIWAIRDTDQPLFEKVSALSLKFLMFRDIKAITSLTRRISSKTNLLIKDSPTRSENLRFLCNISKFSHKLFNFVFISGPKSVLINSSSSAK